MKRLRLLTTMHVRLAASVVLLALLATTAVFADPGGVVVAPTEVAPGSGVPINPNFAFELEAPPQSLKEVPIWWELEQMLDNPYALHPADQRLAEEVSGFPAYETGAPTASATNIQRRRSYLPAGCDYNPATAVPACDDALLAPLLIHPLNYNHMNGEELRLLNPNYPGGPFDVPGELVQCSGDPTNTADPEFCHVETQAATLGANGLPEYVTSPADDTNRWVWVNTTVDVSPGADRVPETAIDFNSPMRPQIETPYTTYPATFGAPVCMVTTELVPTEGSILCGGDPGDPGYAGFGVLDPEGYSVPAVPGVAGPTTAVTTQRLYDPTGCDDRNAALPGSCTPTADGGGTINRLLKPTIRKTCNWINA